MRSYVKPDMLTRVPIQGGELVLSPGYDVVHYFPPLGAMMLKYWNTDNNGMSNVMVSIESGTALSEHCGLSVVTRPFILATEHEALLDWRSRELTDEAYGFDTPPTDV